MSYIVIRNFFAVFCSIYFVTLQATAYKLHSTYTTTNGLCSNNVRNLFQDPLGYIWISTEDGLDRFNGKKFLKYTNISSCKHKTLSPDIRATCYDSVHHFLYVLNSVKGFSVIDPLTGNVVNEIMMHEKKPDVWNITMTYSNHKLWIGSSDGLKVYNIEKKEWERMPETFFLRAKDLFTIRTIYQDSQNRVWVFIDNYGIALLNAKTNSILKIIPLLKLCVNADRNEMHFTSIVELTKETFLIGTSEGLKKIDLSKNNFRIAHKPLSGDCPLNREGVTAMAVSKGSLFISCQSAFYKVNRALSTFYQINDTPDKGKDWLNTIHYLFCDKEENIWIASEQGLAYLKNIESPFESISNEEFPVAKFNNVYQVQPIDDNFLIGMKKGLVLYKRKNKEFELLKKDGMFNYFFYDFNANLIVSTRDGLYVLKNNQLTSISKIYPEWKSTGLGNINSIVRLSDSIYIMGSENNRGVFIWNVKKKQINIINNRSSPIRLRSNIVNNIHRDHQGNVWVLSDLGIDIINKELNKITYLNFKDKNNKIEPILFFDMCETQNDIWITSYGLGLIQLNRNWQLKAIFTTEQGLSCNAVYKIFNYKNDKLIISTNNGLSVFNIKNSRFYNFYETDGLHANTFEENSGIEYRGKFIAGGLNGFTIIDPSLIKMDRETPKLYIDRIGLESPYETKDTCNILLTCLDIPSDIIRVSMHLSALHYTNPTKTKISYKIDEINDHWISTDDQDVIQLMGVPPGTYTVHIKSANEHDFWNETPVTIRLHFLPKWYQSILFNVFVMLLVLSAIYALYRYRLSQIKKQQEIRKNIASDLHDDIGSSLNTVKIFAHLAKKEKDNSHYLTEIESALAMASMGMRDMIWVLDDSNDTWKELIERIKKFALPILSAQQIELKINTEDNIEMESLSKEEKKNLLLITKEAINNSVKYSQCTIISISLQRKNGITEFKVVDNGIGFDMLKSVDGHGLKNMRYRATQMRYKIIYESAVGSGTTIKLQKARP